MTAVTKISFEDRGQDFTSWYVRDGVVIDCQPNQGRIWTGVKLQSTAAELVPGDTLSIYPPSGGPVTTVNYPVVHIEKLPDVEAAAVEGYGRKWAEMKAVDPGSWGL